MFLLKLVLPFDTLSHYSDKEQGVQKPCESDTFSFGDGFHPPHFGCERFLHISVGASLPILLDPVSQLYSDKFPKPEV